MSMAPDAPAADPSYARGDYGGEAQMGGMPMEADGSYDMDEMADMEAMEEMPAEPAPPPTVTASVGTPASGPASTNDIPQQQPGFGGLQKEGANFKAKAKPERHEPEGAKDTRDVTKKSGGSEAKPGDEATTTDEPKDLGRQIIYTAEMTISVFKVEEAMKKVEVATIAAGGYIQQMSEGYYVLRLPAPALRGVMDDVGGLGVVESRSLQARDVTEEFVDLQSRIRVLRETREQLLALLKRAHSVKEALEVRQALDAVTMELEVALGRLRMLENLIGFSTLTLHISERGPHTSIPSSNDPFPWVDSLGVESTEWK
ncbi:MAG: DUF4349 domain-containing protein [Nannocystaceae bacterium]|nr:DUF4349 domain-containing protein [Myxococcales bacterium]